MGDANRLAEVSLSRATRPIDAELLDAAGRDAARVSETILRETIDLVATASFDWLFPPNTLRGGVVTPPACARMETINCGPRDSFEAPAELAELVTRFSRDLAGTTGSDVRWHEPVDAP